MWDSGFKWKDGNRFLRADELQAANALGEGQGDQSVSQPSDRVTTGRSNTRTTRHKEEFGMRFVYTAPVYHPNQHFAVKALLDAGHEVSFLSLRHEHSHVYDALHPTILGESSAMRAIGMRVPPLSSLWSKMRRFDPTVVVVRDPNSAYGLLSVAMARLMGLNVIFYSQGPMHRQLKWWQVLMRSLPAWAARAKWMTPIIGSPERYSPPFQSLRYVPFALDPQTAPEQRLWFRDGVINVLNVGKYEVRKNHQLFLKAIANLSGKYPVRATIVGECTTAEHWREMSKLKKLHKTLGIGDKVHFKTNLAYWDVHREYASHDVFVLPSRDEPAGISLLEAMAHSVPAVCSESCGLKACIRPGENGYVFRTDDVNDLTACLESVISDRVRLMEMGARSYEIIISENDPSKYVEQMVAIAGENG